MPIPDGQDPVLCQAQVNEVIKTIIVHTEVIFPSHRELEGPVYEKCMSGGEEYWWAESTSTLAPDGVSVMAGFFWHANACSWTIYMKQFMTAWL